MQVAPFTVNAVGAVLVPPCDPLNPMSVLAPGARVAFHPSPVAVTAEPVCDQVALQPCVTCWPDGNANPRVQVTGDVEVLVIFTLPVKPTFQLLALYLTAQLLVVVVGRVVKVTDALAADTFPATSLARTA